MDIILFPPFLCRLSRIYLSLPFFPFGPLESPSSSSSWEEEEEEAEAEKTWDEYQEENGGGERKKSAELALFPHPREASES